MTTYPHWLLANFGGSYSGQAANVRYTLYDNTGTQKVTGLGTMTEDTDDAGIANTGTYRLLVNLDLSWAFPLRAKFSIAGQVGVVAEEVIPLEVSNLLNLLVPIANVTNKTDQSVGDCLSLARAMGAGAASISGTTVTILGPDGSTVRTFTTNNAAVPTSRT